MNTQLTLLGVSLFALSATAFAQAPTKPKPVTPAPAVAQQSLRLHPLGNVIGLEIKNQEDKKFGEVEDLVLDSVDGSIDYVVISQGGVLGIGEDRYLVPFECVRFVNKDAKDEDLHATTTLSEERIKKAPKFVKEQRIGPDIERSIREAAGLTPEPMQPRARNSELVTAKRVKGTQVLGATQEKIGELEETLVDPLAGLVAYNVLATGGTLGLGEKHYSLPWEVIRIRVEGDNKIEIGSDLTKDRLAKAPEFDSKDPKRMASIPYLKEVYSYYSIEPYYLRTLSTLSASAPRVSVQHDQGKDGR